MAETVNRKQIATHCGVSLPTVDEWVKKGCPFVTRGSKGVPWEFSLLAVEEWLAKFWARPTQVVSRRGTQTFSKTEQAEAVKALGYVLRHVGRLTAEMALKAGASLPIAYALDQMVSIGVSDLAEAHLADRGVRGVDMMETFLRPEDEPDWQALAQTVGETFDEDACERYQSGIAWFQPSPETLAERAAHLEGRGND